MQTLKIGDLIFDNIFIQGPLAGVSNMPFRLLVWRHSRPAFTFTEMISAQTILHRFDLVKQRYLNIHSEEGPVCVQLSGNDPTHLAEAVKRVSAAGASLINLNCGCPVKKIRAKKAGSYLLSDSQRLYQLALALKNNTHLPVSLKIRVDGGGGDAHNATVAQIVADTGMDFLVVHGRHWQEDYSVTPHYAEIKYFVDSLTIPVIGNGDICDQTTLTRMLATQCAGVMIGRASVGKPWLIQQLKQNLYGTAVTQYQPQDYKQALMQHVSALLPLFDNEHFALLHARSFIKYYLRNIPDGLAFIPQLSQASDFNDFLRVCHALLP